MIGDKNERESWGIPPDNKGFRRWMMKETYWCQLYEVAKSLMSTLTTQDGIAFIVPEGFAAHFRVQRLRHFAQGFAYIHDKMKNSIVAENQPEIHLSAKRVIYRYTLTSFTSCT